MTEWFETLFTGLYAQVQPHVYSDKKAAEQAVAIRKMLGLRKGESVMDIPCGGGRLSLALARMGMKMTGVDLTAQYIRIARGRSGSRGLKIRWLKKDMRHIEFANEFDAVFNWGGSFGYFSDKDNLLFCRRVHQALKSGGRFLVEGYNRSRVLANWQPRIERTAEGVRIVNINKYRKGRVVGEWIMSKGNVEERHRSSIWFFGAPEIRTMLGKAGFRNIRLYGYPPIDRLTRHSGRIIAVGRKP